VEHGITEMVNGGVDIVEWMLRLQLAPHMAPLDLDALAKTTTRSGWAIEVRASPQAPPACARAQHVHGAQRSAGQHSLRAQCVAVSAPAPAATHCPPTHSRARTHTHTHTHTHTQCTGAHQWRGPGQGLPALPWRAGRGGVPHGDARRARGQVRRRF
jgi:hypothetical protein